MFRFLLRRQSLWILSPDSPSFILWKFLFVHGGFDLDQGFLLKFSLKDEIMNDLILRLFGFHVGFGLTGLGHGFRSF